MAKRKVEMQIQDDPSMPMGENGNVLVDADIIEDVVVVDVDASGRKKKVDIAHEQLEELGLKNTSQIIRYLDSQNFSRSAIANFTGKRYQHVRNVLVTPLKKG